MCRSQSQGGRRCSGRSGGGQAASPSAEHSPQMARLLGTDTPEGAARFDRLSALRDSGYTGPVDQDGNATTMDAKPVRRGDKVLPGMLDQMREWRSRPVPEAKPGKPMSDQMKQLLGCDTPEGMEKYERGRAYREAGYNGPLDSSNNIPDPDDPRERPALHALAALSETHSG